MIVLDEGADISPEEWDYLRKYLTRLFPKGGDRMAKRGGKGSRGGALAPTNPVKPSNTGKVGKRKG